MKKILLFFWIFMSLEGSSQQGKSYGQPSLPSKILNGERKYAIYLPPDYETSERMYPVLYLLHGSGDDQTGWIQFGEVLQITDKAIEDGLATPMVIVMPDAQSGQKDILTALTENGTRKFFLEEIPFIEKVSYKA